MAKVLIIKLGYSETLDNEISSKTSLGDVLRTTVILHQFAEDHVTWLVDEKAVPLLKDNPLIDRILLYDLNSVLQLQSERFDTVINFEKVPGVCALADRINAWRRYGFRFDETNGEALAYDGSEAVYEISNDAELKRRNAKYWQEFLVEMVGGQWAGQEYVLGHQPKTEEIYDVGFNWSVGSKWPNKMWPKENWQELERILSPEFSISWQEGLQDIRDYIDWINSCRILVTSDSLGMHIALALKKKVVILFGPTHSGETYLYERGIEMFPQTSYDCVPCFSPDCTQPQPCLEFITPEQVEEKVREIAG